MFWPSIYPRSRSPCRNASRWAAVDEGEPLCRTPIRGTFFGCCASAGWTEARDKLTNKTPRVFLPIPACLLPFIAGCPEPFSLPPFFIGYGIAGNSLTIASLVLLSLAVLPLPASAWNIPGHMLSAAIAYQVLQQENPSTIDKVKAVLEKHPWYANQWQARLQDVPIDERDQ